MQDRYFIVPPQPLPGGQFVVRLGGELDIAAADAAGQAFADAVDQACTGVIADLAMVTFMDASGLGMLVSAHHRSSHLPAGLRLAAVPARVTWLLRASGLDRYLPAFPSVADAVSPRLSMALSIQPGPAGR